jgi:PIN domain nuclease of toxin-antitoxin system
VIHLDTHAVVWLFTGEVHRFPAAARTRLGASRPLYSPMVRLELSLLHEIGRITASAGEILAALAGFAGLHPAESNFERVSQIAATLTWTRDPFDRLIAAHALADDLPLLTRDETLLAHCRVATWE